MHGEECSARHTCPHLAHMKEGSVGFHRICIAFLMPLSAHWSPLFSSFGRFLPKNNRLQGRGLRAFRSTQKNNSTLIGGLRFFLLIKMVCEDWCDYFPVGMVYKYILSVSSAPDSARAEDGLSRQRRGQEACGHPLLRREPERRTRH